MIQDNDDDMFIRNQAAWLYNNEFLSGGTILYIAYITSNTFYIHYLGLGSIFDVLLEKSADL